MFAVALFGSAAARAQAELPVALPEEGPAKPTQTVRPIQDSKSIPIEGSDIDLSNIVISAAKGVTTVQEAPAIITVITADAIRSRGFLSIAEALATVPGWFDNTAFGNLADQTEVRGVHTAMLLMHDGISMFDPGVNVASLNRSQPLESLKRIEVVTGPGGVLWGANSFLGVVNLISKDGGDVNGIEANAGYGDGPGNKQDFRAYAMFGKTFFHDKLKIFQHVSFEDFLGPVYSGPSLIALSPSPQPNGPAIFGPVVSADPPRSWLLTIDGKYSLGPVSLYYSVPVGKYYSSLGFGSGLGNYPHTFDFYDRYAVLEYKDRFFGSRLGITAKGYYTQFQRQFDLGILPASTFFPPGGDNGIGGLRFEVPNPLVQRFGATLDAEILLPMHNRLLVGGEAYRESIDDAIATFDSPASGAALPTLCPVDLNGVPLPHCARQFINNASRTVAALYVDDQWPIIRALTLEGGVRLEKGFGERGYDLVPVYSGAAVVNIHSDYHLKATYATGFRPAVFNYTDAPPGGLNYTGNPTLKPERSQAFQGEINAHMINIHNIKSLDLRLDYSYTVLSNFIDTHGGQYTQTGKRAIHSVEAEGRLNLGRARLQASYTYLHTDTSNLGDWRVTPNQWFTVGAVFTVVDRLLDLNANLNVFGGYEDPDRYPSGSAGVPGATTQARASDFTWDRLTPVALLQLGANLRLINNHMSIAVQFYNALNQRYFLPDPFSDLTTAIEFRPTPAPGFSFFASVGYHP